MKNRKKYGVKFNDLAFGLGYILIIFYQIIM